MSLFENTKNTAKLRGLSLQRTAELSGLSKNAIYNWKTIEPSPVSLKAVADVLGVSVDYLLGKTDDMHANNSSEPMDLDKALSEEGMAMFDGQPLSNEYKRALLAMLNTMKGNGK